MRLERDDVEKRLLVGMFVGASLLGLLVRWVGFLNQTLVDDEWHSLSFVLGRNLGWILTHFSAPNSFTSIPLDLHAWILLRTLGWSEMTLRLPFMIFGLACLVVGPLLATSVLDRRTAATFALLLAISPLLVFYARLARPYSAVACLGFISIVSAARWLRSGRLSDGIAYAACGVLAVYWHPFSAIAIGTMGVSVLAASVARPARHVCGSAAIPSCWQVISVLAAAAVLGAVMMLPALVESFGSSMGDVARAGTAHGSSWLSLACLFSGVDHPVLVVIMWLLAAGGLLGMLRRSLWLGITIALLFPLQVMALMVVRPHSCHVGIVLARYSIVLLPVYLLLVAHGVQTLLAGLPGKELRRTSLHVLLPLGLAAVLLMAGPLPRTWRTPNNFTNHGVFQHDYGMIDWSRSFDSAFAPKNFPFRTSIRTEEVSGFYGYLNGHPGDRPIVEYFALVGDHFNLHYFYQFYHRRPVILGYAVGLVDPVPLPGGGVYGNTCVDDILNLVADPSAFRFENHMDMTDFEAMRARDVEYVILHKQYEAEFARIAAPPASLPALLELYRRDGYPVFEDRFIAVFSLDPVPSLMPTDPL